MKSTRDPAHNIAPVFVERWSPRAFVATTMPERDLLTMLEAARWAPSAYNEQPWRFFYALRDQPHFGRFVGLLDSFNRSWASNASAVVFVASDKVRRHFRAGEPMWSHSFDTGAAWAQLALQATHMGYVTHAMAGLDRERAPSELKLPGDLHLEIAIAVGRRGPTASLPSELRKLEEVSQRRPLSSFTWAGPYQP